MEKLFKSKIASSVMEDLDGSPATRWQMIGTGAGGFGVLALVLGLFLLIFTSSGWGWIITLIGLVALAVAIACSIKFLNAVRTGGVSFLETFLD